MYSQRTILLHLEEFAAREGWMPTYHTYDEVREFDGYIRSIVKMDSNSKSSYIQEVKPLTAKRRKEVARWIENEQVLCGLDSSYWETNYAWVCDEKGQIFKFKNRRSQEIFDAIITTFDEKQVSIELLILKARQVGISTKVALKFINRLMFVPNTQAVMASVQKDKSELIGRILDTAYDRSPWWLVPQRMPKRSFDNGSILSIQSGMQATGLAQGWTPTCLVKSAPVRVANGGVKSIIDVAGGETILTNTGRLAKTRLAAFRTLRRGEPTRIIKMWGCYKPLETTLDHRYWTPDEWAAAENLRAGDYVRHPVREITEELTGETVTSYARGKIDPSRATPIKLQYSAALGYLAGLYVAEGSCHASGIGKVKKRPYLSEFVLSVHRREAERTEKAIHAVLGPKQYIYTKYRGDGAKLYVSCAWLARWFAEHFGRKYEKHVPDWVWSAGRSFASYLLKGYLDGDGHAAPGTNNVVAPCICLAVTLQMRDLVCSLGFGWSSIYHRPGRRTFWGGWKKETWVLVLSGPCGYAYRVEHGLKVRPSREVARHWRYGKGKEWVDVEIESVTEGFAEEFWDLEVDDPSHSFASLSCVVHNCIHVSELADIPDPRRVIEEGLFRAAHSSRNLFMVLEGTGGGNTGWLADTWRSSKEDWPKGLARLCPIFIPWAMCPDIYPEEDWLRKFPLPDDWNRRIHQTTKTHVTKCESYIRNTPYLAKIAGRDWKMPPEQQWFWQFNYDQACKNHTQKTWAAQMPADDFEALTGVHDSVFDPEVLMGIEDRIYEVQSDSRVRRVPVQAFAITGHDVDEVFYPPDERIDWTKECVRVEWESYRGQHYQWTMIPVLPGDEDKEHNTMDYLLVYEWPRKGSSYSCGIDTADGLGKEDEERTCLSVAKNRFGGQSDQQVAELTSNRINSAQVVAFAACVGALYGPSCPDNRGLKFCIEQIQGPGDTCQHQLKMMGFFNHHKPRRYDSKKVKDDSTKKEGWYSSSWSVPMLMTRFAEAVNGGWYEPRSKWLIEELRTLERHETSGKSKMEHRQGKFDDRVRAAATAYFTAHDFDVLTERAQKRYAPPTKKQTVSKEKCTFSQVSVGW